MTHVALALAAPDTPTALVAMQQAAGRASLVELRLDLMAEFDLPRLLAARPLPVIVTCRAAREGGRWQGTEAARLDVLRQAAALGADYVDLEGDVAAAAATFDRRRTQIILSRHDFNAMPDLAAQAAALWDAGADVVKVVGMAHTLADCAAAVRVLIAAQRPTIAIAMGRYGVASRLLAFGQPYALLSFAAPDHDAGTAPGQISLSSLLDDFRVREITPSTRLVGWLGHHLADCAAAMRALAARGEAIVLVPMPLAPDEDEAIAARLLMEIGVEVRR